MSLSEPAYPSQLTFHHYRNQTIPDGPSTATTETPNPAHNDPTESGKTRRCTVRGCTKDMPSDSSNKMCETCRSRHRMYAITKRAKRKKEKAAIISQGLGQQFPPEQPALWVSGNKSPIVPVAPSSQDEQSDADGKTLEGSASVPASYTPPNTSSWDRALDPRFFTSRITVFTSKSSELAGALTLPIIDSHLDNSTAFPHVSAASIVTVASVNEAQAPRESEVAPLPDVNTAAGSSSSGALESSPSSSNHRFCSVKGCKALIPDDYFFKMCEPCRNRYRGYGTTKRAKWKRDRMAVDAELETFRQEEDKRRIAAGLPPLSEVSAEDREAWESSIINEQVHHSDGDALPARMCTVSHCHKILPGHYKYRRCEQHRLQNRYHSKLKRVREKESKSQRSDELEAWVPLNQSEDNGKTKDKDKTAEPLFTHAPMEIERETRTDGESIGVPPAARGIRRTNHVCSIKVCYNLLAPQVPWKMCDTCRAHDRLVRKSRRLLSSVILSEGGADTTDQTESPSQDMADIVKSGNLDIVSPPSTLEASVVPLCETTINQSVDVSSISSDHEIMFPAGEILSNCLSVGPRLTKRSKPPSATASPDSSIVSNLAAEPALPSISTLLTTTHSHAPKKRGKRIEKENSARELDARASTSRCPAPLPYQPHSYAPYQGQYQMPYYILPPVNPPYVIPQVRQDPSAPLPDASQVYVHHPPYTPQPFYPSQPPYQYPPYPHPPYPYGPQQFLPPYNSPLGQPPYGSTPCLIHPYSHSTNYNCPTTGPLPSEIKSKKRKQNETAEKASTVRIGTNPAAVSNAMPVSSSTTPSPTSLIVETTDTEPVHDDTAPGKVTRPCINKACHRMIPTTANGTLCERCRARMKKRQAKAKQRFRLEPRKMVVAGNRGKPMERSDGVDVLPKDLLQRSRPEFYPSVSL